MLTFRALVRPCSRREGQATTPRPHTDTAAHHCFSAFPPDCGIDAAVLDRRHAVISGGGSKLN